MFKYFVLLRIMELKSVGVRINSWDLFFQCEKCGKVLMKRINEYININEVNENLKQS